MLMLLQSLFSLVWLLLHLTATKVSAANVSFKIDPHPEGLTCTLYIDNYSSGSDLEFFEKAIHDNKDSSILSIIGNGNVSLAVPTVRFFDRCSFNLVIQSMELEEKVCHELRTSRGISHLKCIVVHTKGCKYRGKRVYEFLGYRLQMLLYFAKCPHATETLFPNAIENFVYDYYYYDEVKTDTTFFKARSDFSVHDNKIPRKFFKSEKIFVALSPRHSERNDLHETRRQLCRSLKLLKHPQSSVTSCDSHDYFEYSLEQLFNITYVTDTYHVRTGSVIITMYVYEYDPFVVYSYVNEATLYHQVTVQFLYCLPRQQPQLLTLQALASPFDLITWTISFLCLFFTLFIYIDKNSSRSFSEKIMLALRLMFYQDINLRNVFVILLVWGCFILTMIYTTFVTSCLLVPNKVSPKENFSTLLDENYTYLFDRLVDTVLIEALNKSKLEIPRDSMEYTNDPFTIGNVDATHSLYGKVLRTMVLNYDQTTLRITATENILRNMTCFIMEPTLINSPKSYSFSHPWAESMRSFTITLNEAGILSLYQSLENNFIWLNHTSGLRDRNKNIKDDSEDDAYIKLKEATPIFYIYLALNFTGIVFFVVELIGIKSKSFFQYKFWKTTAIVHLLSLQFKMARESLFTFPVLEACLRSPIICLEKTLSTSFILRNFLEYFTGITH